MSVRFVFSRGYDSDTRLHGSEEFRHRRILTSMMADFQHFRMQLFRAILRKNFRVPPVFSASPGRRMFRRPVVQPQHQRIIVLLLKSRSLREQSAATKKSPSTPIPAKRLAAKLMFDGDFFACAPILPVSRGPRKITFTPDAEFLQHGNYP